MTEIVLLTAELHGIGDNITVDLKKDGEVIARFNAQTKYIDTFERCMGEVIDKINWIKLYENTSC